MDDSLWTAAVGVTRWALYALMLLASGTAVFLLGMPVPETARRAASRIGFIAAVGTAFAFVMMVGIGGAQIMAGPVTVLLETPTWAMGFDTTLGRSAMAGVAGAALLAAGFSRGNRM